MMLSNPDGTFMGGPLDVLCILHDVNTGRYHPAFFEEAPFPGPVADVRATTIVRLKSKMHHTGGFATLAEAVDNLDNDLSVKLKVPPTNVWRAPRDWDGELGIVWLEPNWLLSVSKANAELADMGLASCMVA